MDDKKHNKSNIMLLTQSENQINGRAVKVEHGVAEFYRFIPEEIDTRLGSCGAVEAFRGRDNEQQTNGTVSDIKMVQEENAINDGADEQMLGAEDNGKLTEKREEVKFIKGGDQQNGDAKIDIGTGNGKAFTGMTKEELMKFANDPFWVRLRWIFFVAFWAIWVAMLVGAILIIIDAPKCAAPEPLPWFKRGPLAKFSDVGTGADGDLESAKKLQATGAIYELPAHLTYSVKEPEVEQQIKDVVAQYKGSDVNVIFDITPNYATIDSRIMKDALADESKRSAFIWIENPSVPNNWLSTVNGSAWTEVQPGNYVLSQFGDNLFDLHMNDTIVRKELESVLRHLVDLGVKGFRLKNTKFFLLTKNIQDELPSNDPKYFHTQYGFWTHTQTTFQEGLGNVLYDYKVVVKNASTDGFLSVAEDVVRPDVYLARPGQYGIDMPMYGRFAHTLSAPHGKNVQNELLNTITGVGNSTWLQWNIADMASDSHVTPAALGLFVSLLPGVPVIPVDSVAFTNISAATFKHIEQLRLSPSYMHGDFQLYDSDELVAYSRIKSGNPGYFVIFNPTDVVQTGIFSNMGLPEKMTVDTLSDNYNVTSISVKSKVATDKLEVSPFATIVLTYVPIKSG